MDSTLSWTSSDQGPAEGGFRPSFSGEGSSELPASEAQPVYAMEGLTPLLSVKITDLLLEETLREGAQHRQQ